jgi:hypothetical protein
MAQRPGILVNHFVKADGKWPLTKSPNAQPDVITAEVRCHWPYLAPKAEVRAALLDCFIKALAELDEKHPGTAAERNVWLEAPPSQE